MLVFNPTVKLADGKDTPNVTFLYRARKGLYAISGLELVGAFTQKGTVIYLTTPGKSINSVVPAVCILQPEGFTLTPFVDSREYPLYVKWDSTSVKLEGSLVSRPALSVKMPYFITRQQALQGIQDFPLVDQIALIPANISIIGESQLPFEVELLPIDNPALAWLPDRSYHVKDGKVVEYARGPFIPFHGIDDDDKVEILNGLGLSADYDPDGTLNVTVRNTEQLDRLANWVKINGISWDGSVVLDGITTATVIMRLEEGRSNQSGFKPPIGRIPNVETPGEWVVLPDFKKCNETSVMESLNVPFPAGCYAKIIVAHLRSPNPFGKFLIWSPVRDFALYA